MMHRLEQLRYGLSTLQLAEVLSSSSADVAVFIVQPCNQNRHSFRIVNIAEDIDNKLTHVMIWTTGLSQQHRHRISAHSC